MPGESRDTRFWNRAARKYAASKIADMVAYERTLERTRQFLRGTDNVLEFGCGTGTTALRLAPFVGRILATDISQEMIAIAREKAKAGNCANATFEAGKPDSAQRPGEAYDAVLGFNVLHLIMDRPPVLQNVRRMLKPGGYFISKTVCLRDLNPFFAFFLRVAVFLMRMVGKAPSVAFLSARDVEREIEAAGFTIVERGRHASKGKDIRPYLVARK